MKKRRNLKVYGLCMCGICLLVILAILFPQIVFGIQDEYQMKNTEVKTRNSLNVSQLYSIYEESIYERMKNLANWNVNSMMVTAVEPDFENDGEMVELLQSIYSQEWVLIFQYIILEPFGFSLDKNVPFELWDCKKYMVYDDDYQNGIALMMWYFDINIVDSDVRVQLLVDSETNEIYYIRVGEAASRIGDTENETAAKVTSKSEVQAKKLYAIVEPFYVSIPFYGEYYEAEVDELVDIQAKEWWEYAFIEENDRQYAVTCLFPYGEFSHVFELLISFENSSYPSVSMGIPTIAELIPEMIQD